MSFGILLGNRAEGPPSQAEREAEVDRALEADDSNLGDVYRFTKRGLAPNDIQAQHGVATVGYVYAYQRSARVLCGDPESFPDKPSVARNICAVIPTHFEALRILYRGS